VLKTQAEVGPVTSEIPFGLGACGAWDIGLTLGGGALDTSYPTFSLFQGRQMTE